MIDSQPPRAAFNVLAIVQDGRLAYEALLLLGSFKANNPGFQGKVFLAEPQPGKRWNRDPRLKSDGIRALLESLGATFLPFENKVFGQSYPHGNKIEALSALPDAPFLFLDTDTLILGDLQSVPFDFARPSASMRREGTWPEPQLYKGATPKSGARFMTALALIWPALSTHPSRRTIGSAIFTSTRAGFSTKAPRSLVSGFSAMRSPSATTSPPHWPHNRWIRGSTRSRCPWSFTLWAVAGRGQSLAVWMATSPAIIATCPCCTPARVTA